MSKRTVYTLKEISLVNVATRIYNCFDLKKYILHCDERTKEQLIREELQIPLVLKDEIVALMKPIELEAHNWMRDHYGIFRTSGEECLSELHWNPDATVNRIRTADDLIRSQRLESQEQFVFSCQYWRGRKIIPVFRKMNYETRQHFLEERFEGNEHLKNVVKWIRDKKAGNKRDCKLSHCWCTSFTWTDVSLHSRFLGCLQQDHRECLLRQTVLA
ncbi:hypothetical protein TNCT_321011 [Trichonephila clavata]|uniref:Uncharacterized protein n=1 Tax=Trichonephila clavata TaxID=2740835 RepID=A0A8X6GJH8_TRICU|nr:hypothetical protein TNCT_321011 [Trichonephila clavata]